jgi:hypothetical protein
MRANLEIAQRTFVKPLSPLQIAATEIVPQGISLALSVRELIRQAYLYSAAILIRPLVERAGTIYYLQAHLDAVEAWRSVWPRRSQPSFDAMLTVLHPGAASDTQDAIRAMLHKLVHSDPAGSVYNMFERADGVPCSLAGRSLTSRRCATSSAPPAAITSSAWSLSRRRSFRCHPPRRHLPGAASAQRWKSRSSDMGIEKLIEVSVP